jgi:transcriptional regulator with XRE-family HTH domain
MSDSTALPYVLKCLRHAAGLDVETAAQRAGISAAALRHIERGFRVPKWPTVCALADVLGVGTDAFREGVNTRPVESARMRDARLAGLGQWHREESNRRRINQEAYDGLSPDTRRAIEASGRRIGRFGEVMTAEQLERLPPEGAELGCGVRIAPVAPPAAVAGDDQAEARQLGDDQAEAGPVEPIIVDEPPLGERLQRVMLRQAEAGRLDRGDKRAFTQARRRCLKSGKDNLDAQLAGYAAVARHRELTRDAEKPSARIDPDRRSRVNPTPDTAGKAPRRRGQGKTSGQAEDGAVQ